MENAYIEQKGVLMGNNKKNIIQVKTAEKKFPISEDLYGLFFEEINRSGDGGLYPELLRNRSFEDSMIPERCETSDDGFCFKTPNGWIDQFSNGEGLRRWKRKYELTSVPAWYEDHAEMILNTEDTLNGNREAALDVFFEAKGIIYNTGFNGISIEKGKQYVFYMFAKTLDGDATLSVSVEKEGEIFSNIQKIYLNDNAYVRYEILLEGQEDNFNANLMITSECKASVRIGFISLMPVDTYKNHGLRKDLMEMLEGLHAKFLRFPGGCAVEGITKETSYRFADTLGPVWERKSKQIPWHYRTTNGIGYHEFLQMCEDLNVSAMYVINCGITCQARNAELFDDDEIEEWIQQACDAIDYAISDPSTNEWGHKRALAGHPEPFDLKYVEIGNENNHQPYYERYPRFYERLKKRYPDIHFISNTHTEAVGLPTEIVDEHFYNNTTFFIKGSTYFNEKDRTTPNILLGEYAVTCGSDITNLKAALAESAFLIGIENNQDLVTLSSYAPLFSNVDYKSWHPNLIEFNNHEVFGIPSYYALSMLGKNRGKEVIGVHVTSEMTTEKRIGRPGLVTNALGLSMKNVLLNGELVHVSHTLSGKMEETADEEMITVPGKPSFMADFPGFAHSLNDYTFAIFGDKDLDTIVYEGDLKIDAPDKEISLTLYNYYSPQLAQIDETMDLGNEWTPDSVDFCSWTIKNGKSNVFNTHWFSNETLAEEVDIDIPYGEYFHFKIETRQNGYDCYMNEKLIQSAQFEPFPTLVASASEDEAKIVVKIVNFSEYDTEVEMQLDSEVENNYVIESLGGVDGKATNSINEPFNVISKTTEKKGAGECFGIGLKANSLNIITLNKAGNKNK